MTFNCGGSVISLVALAMILTVASFHSDAAYAATVLPSKNHQAKCPANYFRDGDYCIPGKRAKKGMKKSGKCPGGYFADGGFCMKAKK